MDKLNQLMTHLWQDKWLILLSLALAFVCWQRIHRTIGYETTLSHIPIELIAPDGWSLLSSSLDDVSITLRGSQEEIRLLSEDNLRVIIPLPEPNAQKEASLRFSKTHLLNPSNARLIRFNPPQINVSFDQTVEKLLPVKATFTGHLRDGLEIAQATCKPAGVQIRGAKKIIDSLDRIETQPIVLDRRPASFMETIGLALPDTPGISADTQRIDVRVEINEQIRTRQFLNIPLRILNVPNNSPSITLVPEVINLTLSGAQQKVDRIRPENITAYVRCDQLDATTTYDLPVQVDLPDGIILNNTEPSVVKVNISFTP
jgi:YbbR domain-containing protein